MAHKPAVGDPHHTQYEEADDEAYQGWKLLGDFLPKELDLIFWCSGNLDVEHQNGHCDGKNAVTDRLHSIELICAILEHQWRFHGEDFITMVPGTVFSNRL